MTDLTVGAMIEEQAYNSRFDPRPVQKRIGLVALATDHTIEADFRRLVAGDDLAVHATRVRYANPTTPENLLAMLPHLTEAASIILPDEDLDALVFGCTSASVVIGEDVVRKALSRAKRDVTVITPSDAAISALRALSARRICVLTPYFRETAEPMLTYLSKAGFTVEKACCLRLADDREMARIPPSEITRIAGETLVPGVDAIFIACTALRAAEAAPEIERAFGIPVVTSNLAAAWAVLRACGISPRGRSDVRLFNPIV